MGGGGEGMGGGRKGGREQGVGGLVSALHYFKYKLTKLRMRIRKIIMTKNKNLQYSLSCPEGE